MKMLRVRDQQKQDLEDGLMQANQVTERNKGNNYRNKYNEQLQQPKIQHKSNKLTE